MKALKISLKTLLGLIILLLLVYFIYWAKSKYNLNRYLKSLGADVPTLSINKIDYRDLNKNGVLDSYENPALSTEARVNNLIGLMTLEEKAGCMFFGMIGMTDEGNLMEAPLLSSNPLQVMVSNFIPHGPELIIDKKMNCFAPFGTGSARVLARYNNQLQDLAARTRLGIPISLATDPRHTMEFAPGISQGGEVYSSWPNQLGLAATRDPLLARSFGDIARQEYLATGFRVALHPMADLATEPRWSRTSGTFGEDVTLASAMLRNYIQGFQGDSLTAESVACMAKHFPGSGTHPEGHEPHFKYGAEQSYSGDNFAYHIKAFSEGTQQTAQIMTSYGIIKGQTKEDVAVAFNRELVSELLRDSLRFDGVICTDWNVITDTRFTKMLKGGSSSWGVEHLSPKERIIKAIEAGVDQFGGENVPELIVEAVRDGKISEERINQSVKRILKDKFDLGLFDNPYVNEDNAERITRNPRFVEASLVAQRKSAVLLKNKGLLPLKKESKIYMEGLRDINALVPYGELVENPEEADVIIKHIDTPFEPKTDYLIERFLGQTGRLFFTEEELDELLKNTKEKPTVFVINLKRPAVLSPIDVASDALIAEFGITDKVLLEILFGDVNPSGRLPFEIPSSWEAVLDQLEDVPYDSNQPLYPFGHGLSY
nr:glycoside hydrolase family 3 protein [Allomuricauda sp.]